MPPPPMLAPPRAHDAPRGGQDSQRLKAILWAVGERGRASLYVCMYATGVPVPTLRLLHGISAKCMVIIDAHE